MNRLAYAETGNGPLCEVAAAYAYGRASNHPFNDGNKRAAWASCGLFLRVNGTRLAVSAPGAIGRMVQLTSGQLPEAEFATWLRECSVPSA